MHSLIRVYYVLQKRCVLCLSILFLSIAFNHSTQAQTLHLQSPTNSTIDDRIVSSSSSDDEPLKILVIMSYSPLIPWSQDIQKGLISAIDAQDKPINLYIESMYESPAHFIINRANFDLSLRKKYANIHFDGVIAESRSAFEYLQSLPVDDPFFKDMPVYYIYFTLNKMKNEDTTKTVIGAQIDNVNLTLSHLFLARPNTKTIHIFANNTNMSAPYTQLLKQHLEHNNLNVALQYYEYTELESYIEAIQLIPAKDAIIFLPTFIANGTLNLNPEQVLQAIAPHANAPIYSFWHNFVGKGTIGGYLMDSHLYGVDAINNIIAYKETGQLLPKSDIGEWIFDYKQLQKFGISPSDYDSNSKIINTPRTIWEDYPKETSFIIIVALMLLIGLFWYKQYKLIDALNQSKLAEQMAESNASRVAALSTTKSKFMATMSHEIRTPINGMFGALNLLAKQNPTPAQQKYLDIAKYCSTNLLNTVNDVLDFSKLDSGQFEFNPKPFSPHHLMQQVEQYAILISKDTDLTIELDISQLVDVPLLGDEHRLQQILNNLLNNAVKFTPNGSINICARVSSTFAPNHYQLDVAVTDTGIGIAQVDVDKLFTPFIQINDTLERAKEGSGLGLSICKELIKMMDGKITVTSTVGEGSCFSFYVVLPQALEGVVNDDSHSSIDAELDSNLPPLRILLVEDNEINQEVMKAQLALLGHHVDIANNGQCALDMLLTEHTHFDVILMDIQMPVLNGYDTTVAIRSGKAGEYYRQTPIIALSAHANLHDQPEYNLALFSAYLVKPAEEKILQQTLYDVM